jgi:hypothetical protein
MNETIETLNKLTSPRNPDALFWDQAWDAANQIEELNNDNKADPYNRLSKVQTILEEVECAGTFVKGRRATETVFLVLAVAQAINAATWDHFLAGQVTE